jgi:hypothetical protein
LDREALNQLKGLGQTDLRRVLFELERIKAIKVYPGHFTVVNSNIFQEVIRREFFSPLVEHLLQPSIDDTDVEKIAERPITAVETGEQNLQIGSEALRALLGELGNSGSD